jgi:hypothetical protein
MRKEERQKNDVASVNIEESSGFAGSSPVSGFQSIAWIA